MSLSAGNLDSFLAAGLTAEQIVALVKADIEEREKASKERRAKDAERQRRHRESRDVTVTADVSQAKGPSEVPPQPPLPTNHQNKAPLNPPKRQMIPADWTPPPVAELPPRARACAEQWTDASYQTEGEAFACYWRSERKMKADWRGTWANRIISRHSAIMRDQKFGNAPRDGPKELSAQELREQAEWFVRHGMPDRANDCRRKAIAIENRIAA